MGTWLNKAMSPAGGGWGVDGPGIILLIILGNFNYNTKNQPFTPQLRQNMIKKFTPYPRQRGTLSVSKTLFKYILSFKDKTLKFKNAYRLKLAHTIIINSNV